MASGSPTSTSDRSLCSRSTDTAAGTHTRGPWSPLMTSTAMVFMERESGATAGDGSWGRESCAGGRVRPPPSVFGLLVARLDHLLAAIVAIGGDAMTEVRLTRLRIDGQRRLAQRIVRAVHAALGRGLSA